MPDNEAPKDVSRGFSRPPWLSAYNASWGGRVGLPLRYGGTDDGDPAGWTANGMAGDVDPPAVDELRPTSNMQRPQHGRRGDDANEKEHTMHDPDPGDTNGSLMRHDPAEDDADLDDAGRVDSDRRGGESGSASDELSTEPVSHDGARPPDAPSRRMSPPPWQVRPSAMSSPLDHAFSQASESRVWRSVAQPAPEPTREYPPHPPASGSPPPAAPLPPLPPPPGWSPNAPLPPAWWPAPVWAAFRPDEPPPDWQHVGDGGAPFPPPRSTTRGASGVRRAQTFRVPPSLDEANPVDPRKHAPRAGWRRAVHRATRGHVNPGDSRKDRAQEDLLSQIREPLVGDFRIAVLSIKGGVGKTTTTLGLGSILAIVRRDRVIAVDANPDRGTLAERVRDASTGSTVRDLLTDVDINRYADVRSHTRMAISRLEVLASEQDPAAAEVFDEADYRRTIAILRQYYNVILTDCGTGIMHSAMPGVLDLAHSIVLVSSPAIDAVRSASATLDWLMQHGYSGLVREGHLVLSAARPGSAALKLDKVYEFFESRCHSIHFIPFDPHLAEGTDVDFAMLKPATYEAYLGLAGAVAENFRRMQAGVRQP